jgi:hypothetical protein
MRNDEDELRMMNERLRWKREEEVRGGQEEQVRSATRAGMSRKTKEIPVYDPY